MSGAWKTVTLGEVIVEERDKRRVEPLVAYPLAGVLGFGRGVLLRDAVRGADMSAQFLYRIRAHQLMYSRLKAFEGAFALVPPDADGRYVSNEFPTFDVDISAALPEFLALYLAMPRVWEELQAGSEGMGARRERLQPVDFLDLELDLPPLDEQQRIVAAVDVVARAALAYERSAKVAFRTLRALREELFGDYDSAPVDELLEDIQGGKSPRAADTPPEPGEPGVLKVSAIRPGSFRPDESKRLSAGFVMPEKARIRVGDLLVNRASGTRRLLCSACIVDAVPDNLFLSDKTLRLIPAPDVDARCLVEALAVASVREQIELEGEGSSGAKNLGQEDIRALEVPWPESRRGQKQVADRLATLRRVATAAERRGSSLRTTQKALRDELLAGFRRTPEFIVGS